VVRTPPRLRRRPSGRCWSRARRPGRRLEAPRRIHSPRGRTREGEVPSAANKGSGPRILARAPPQRFARPRLNPHPALRVRHADPLAVVSTGLVRVRQGYLRIECRSRVWNRRSASGSVRLHAGCPGASAAEPGASGGARAVAGRRRDGRGRPPEQIPHERLELLEGHRRVSRAARKFNAPELHTAREFGGSSGRRARCAPEVDIMPIM